MKKLIDVVVIGAGPAGLISAYMAASRGLQVLVVEKNNQLAKKLRITGKGRCNLVNNCEVEPFLKNIRRNSRFLYSSITAFPPKDIMEFFEMIGLPLVVERGNRVFPASSNAHDVAEALIAAARKQGVRIKKGQVTDIEQIDDSTFSIMLLSNEIIDCKAVIIATGGVSYPKTGSTGDGYIFARKFSHTIIPPKASLVPIICNGDESSLQGLSLRNVELVALKSDRLLFRERGEMLFTHFGISGPLVLSLSSYLVDENLNDIEAYIDLKPALDEKTLDLRIVRDFKENINKDFINSLDALLPQKLIPVVVARTGIAPTKKVNNITGVERKCLVDILKRFHLSLSELCPIEEAVITAGGVNVVEVDPKTMMSKITNNMYFAGEILDVDGFTGGFNLGIAFATGVAAGNNILKDER